MNATITLIPVGAVGPQYSRTHGIPMLSKLPEDVTKWPEAFCALQGFVDFREVGIVGGWKAPRLAVIVDVNEEQYGRTVSTRAYGYTGEMFNKDLKVVDHQIPVYFNRLVTAVSSKYATPDGPRTSTHVVSDLHLLQKLDGPCFTVRPEDVLTRLATSSAFDELVGRGEAVMDLRAAFSSPIKGSPVAREHSTTFLKVLMDALNASHCDHMDEFAEDDPARVFGDASARLHTSINSSNAFIRTLKERSAYTQDGHVTFGELLTLFEAEVIYTDRVVNNTPAPTGGLNSIEAAIAATITNAVSGIMGRHGVEAVYLESDIVKGNAIFADKEAFADGPQVEWDGIDEDKELPGFLDEINSTLKVIASSNGYTSVRMSIAINLADVATINLSLDGKRRHQYVFPMYASALLSGMVTHREQVLNDLVQFTELLYTELNIVKTKPIELG